MPAAHGIHAHPSKKLGRKPKRDYPKAGLHLRDYLVNAPTAPTSADWYAKTPAIGMYLNDKLGDCAIAAPCHSIQVWTANASGTETILTDADALAAYSAVSGYDPVTNANDDGCNMQDVVNYLTTTGIAGHKIVGHAKVNLDNPNEVMLAIAWFGSVYLGVDLPVSAQDTSKLWTRPKNLHGNNKPGSWGGHAVQDSKYDAATDLYTCTTWGGYQSFTGGWLKVYGSEAYVLFSLDWLKNGTAPSGLNKETLGADLGVDFG